MYVASVEIIDLKPEALWVPVGFSSRISSDQMLDLPAGYFVKPKDTELIKVRAWFGTDLIEVLVLHPFYFDIQSQHFTIEDEYIKLNGIGFSHTNNLTCTVDHKTYIVQVLSDTTATCPVIIKNSASIRVRAAGMIEEIITVVTVVARPVIGYIFTSQKSLIVVGRNLDSSETCNCIIKSTDGVITTKPGVVVNNTAVECDLPLEEFDVNC